MNNFNTKSILSSLCTADCMPGVKDAMEVAGKLLSKYGDVHFDKLGNVICTVQKASSEKPHILLDAHIDEIGMLVTSIDENGFISFANFGGVDPRQLASSRVVIHTKSKKINGVICSIPPHLAVGDKKANPIDKSFIDVGMSAEKAQESISPGDRIFFTSNTKEMLGDYFFGKAVDDRSGCALILKSLDYLDNIDASVTVIFSSMEEIGGMGAKTGSFSIEPTHAIVVDVTFGDTHDTPSNKTVKMNKGCAIGFSPILNYELSQTMVAIAKEKGIPFQYEVMGAKTGTNADTIVTTKSGVITGLVSIPIRYMHTPVEMVSLQDIESGAKLIAQTISAIAESGDSNDKD